MRQTFIQLLKIDQIKGLCFVRPDYMEPVNLNTKKKKSRRRRTPSPVEFIIEEDSDGVDDVDAQANIAQVDGGDTDSSESEEAPDEDPSDDDFEPSHAVRVKPRQSKRNNSGAAIKRVFSDNRTVYYHEDFDSMSSDEEVIPKSSKRQKPKTSEKRPSESQGPSKNAKKKKIDNEIEGASKKGPKIINTQKNHDDSHPIFSPFKGGKFNEKSSSLYEQIVRSVEVLGDGKKATDGVSLKNIKTYLEKNFKRNVQHKQFIKKLNDAVNQGLSKGQFIRTTLGKVVVLVHKSFQSITNKYHFAGNFQSIHCAQPTL